MYGSVLSCKINKTLRNISGSSLKIFGWKTFRRRCLYYTAVTIALFKTQSVAIMPPLYKTKIIVSLPNVKCPFKLILYDMIPTCFLRFWSIYYALINYFWDNPCIHTLSAAVVSNLESKTANFITFLFTLWLKQPSIILETKTIIKFKMLYISANAIKSTCSITLLFAIHCLHPWKIKNFQRMCQHIIVNYFLLRYNWETNQPLKLPIITSKTGLHVWSVFFIYV